MAILDWFFIGIITLFFTVVMFFSWSDLVRDMAYYKSKKKNVKSMAEHVNKKSKSKIKSKRKINEH